MRRSRRRAVPSTVESPLRVAIKGQCFLDPLYLSFSEGIRRWDEGSAASESNLCERGWWLSKGIYWLVWVGLR